MVVDSMYKGLILHLVRRHWQRLPRAVRSYFAQEDLLGEVLLHLVQVVARYDEGRGVQPQTWLWRVVDNHCRVVVNRVLCCRRGAALMVPYPDGDSAGPVDEEAGVRTPRLLAALDGVEAVLGRGSRETRQFIATFLEVGEYRRCPECVRREIQETSNRVGLTYGDWLTFLRWALWRLAATNNYNLSGGEWNENSSQIRRSAGGLRFGGPNARSGRRARPRRSRAE